MAQYQNQSSGTVIAGRGVRFAPGEIKEGDYQKYADAGLLVLIGDESTVPAPAPAPARTLAPARTPEPAPAREEKEYVTPEAAEDLAAHGRTLEDLKAPAPPKGSEAEKVLAELEDTEPPEPERKSSPRASRKKKKSTRKRS